MTQAENTQKYIDFLNNLKYKELFNIKDEAALHKIDNSLGRFLNMLNIVSSPDGPNGLSEWVATKPVNKSMVEEIKSFKKRLYPYKPKKSGENIKQVEIFTQDKPKEITEDQAIAVLKSSTKYVYEIYKIKRELV